MTHPHPPAPQPAIASRTPSTHPSLLRRAAGDLIFLLAHIAVLLWAALVIYVAAVTNQAALIGVFFLPAFGIDWLDRIPMGSALMKGDGANALK